MVSDLRQFIETRGDPRQVLTRWSLLIEAAAEARALTGTKWFGWVLQIQRNAAERNDELALDDQHRMTDAEEADCALFFCWSCNLFEDPTVISLLEPYMTSDDVQGFWRAITAFDDVDVQ